MMNRKTMQKVVATIAIVGVAASGAITFMSIAATQPAVTVSDVNVNNGQLQENVQLPQNGTQQVTPESPVGEATVETETAPAE